MKADQSSFVRHLEIKDRTGRVIGTKEVVTYQGLLSKAHDEGLKARPHRPASDPLDENSRTAIAKADSGNGQGLVRSDRGCLPESVTSFLTPAPDPHGGNPRQGSRPP